jgi:hypothetical protein
MTIRRHENLKPLKGIKANIPGLIMFFLFYYRLRNLPISKEEREFVVELLATTKACTL